MAVRHSSSLLYIEYDRCHRVYSSTFPCYVWMVQRRSSLFDLLTSYPHVCFSLVPRFSHLHLQLQLLLLHVKQKGISPKVVEVFSSAVVKNQYKRQLLRHVEINLSGIYAQPTDENVIMQDVQSDTQIILYTVGVLYRDVYSWHDINERQPSPHKANIGIYMSFYRIYSCHMQVLHLLYHFLRQYENQKNINRCMQKQLLPK